MNPISNAQLIKAFTSLGQYLTSDDIKLNALAASAHLHNPWFTQEFVKKALKALGLMLNEQELISWFEKEQIRPSYTSPKSVGLILAGNIPLVGLHDILCVLAVGHKALIKLSSQDAGLTMHIANKLIELEPLLGCRIEIAERLQNYDAVIATGSNNTSRYFEYYFGSVPHIIRKNRNSIAVLTGKETQEELFMLGADIFDYFGLGCRNVSKLYVPENYSFTPFFEGIEKYNKIAEHYKYFNNYEYNKAIYLVNTEEHLDNGFLLVKESSSLSSPLGVLYYQFYNSLETLSGDIKAIKDGIQCVSSHVKLPVATAQVGLGECQTPRLTDYADGLNTIQFLQGL